MPFARWPGALRLFGRLQRECSADLPVWLGIGCPDRRMDNLVSRLEPLLSDPLLAQADPPYRLGDDDLKRLRADRERLAQELLELGESPIPASIVQQDFRDGNVAVRGRDYLFYDWSDTVVSHPFFSACRFLEYVESGGGSRETKGRPEAADCRHGMSGSETPIWTCGWSMLRGIDSWRSSARCSG